MANVIDSFVVELGLDPRKFNDGQRQALDQFKKTREGFVGGSKDIEYSAQKSGEAIGGLRTQTLQMFAAVTGATGLVQFATQAIHAGAAVGRLSRNLGVSVQTISRFQGLAEVFGGSAEGISKSFVEITDALEGWKVGDVKPIIAEYRQLGAAGGTMIDINKGVDQTINDIAANMKKLHDQNPATGGYWQRRLGVDPGLYDAMIQKGQSFNSLLKETRTLTDEEAEAAGRAERQWNKLVQTVTKSGQNFILDQIQKTIDDINDPKTILGMVFGPSTAKAAASSAPTGAGPFTSQADKESFIRDSAVKAGIDPNVAMAVAKSEGFNRFSGDNETSFGAFQLHVTPGGRGNAVGDQFKQLTGLDPSDKGNERETIMFALEWAKRHGWGDFHGAANSHIGTWAGIAGPGGTTSTTNSVVINGPINVVTQAKDAAGIAQDIGGAIKKQSFAAQANYGQN